ncbi:MAG: response regulator [Candidatus Hydrogenedentes bacterium]|nr:response regulator [Candidatus Hydrogenedentota bacterium]
MPDTSPSTVSDTLAKRIFELSPVGMAVLSTDYAWGSVNDAFCRAFGYTREELLALTWNQLVFQDDAGLAGKHLKPIFASKRRGASFEARLNGKGDRTFLAQVSASSLSEDGKAPNCILVAVEDLTERRLAEEHRRHAEKMEAIGVLAGGFGHDFNNILATIDGNLDLALEDLPESLTGIREFLSDALNATRRAKRLVQQILAFGRRKPAEHRPLDLRPIATDVARLMRASQPANIEIALSLPDSPLVVKGDAAQMHMAFLNLSTNACDAMRANGGTLSIVLGLKPMCRDGQPQTSCPYASIVVQDTGVGMDDALLCRIFDPYFTTKPKGEGVGMGLAAVHGIVERHGGKIKVTSKPSCGSTFEMLLPVVADTVPDDDAWLLDDGPSGNGELVLFVDDEPSIISIGERSLVRLNYRVVSSTNSQQALDLFRASPDAFDIVVTDQTMPQLTGIDMAREMLQIRPDIPIILCTGYSEKVSEEVVYEAGIRALLSKPILTPVMAQAIEKALRSSA